MQYNKSAIKKIMNLGQFDMFEMLGIEPEPVKVENKEKESKKSKTKGDSKKSDKKKETPEKIKLPAKIFSQYHGETTLTGENEITSNEALERLEALYPDYPKSLSKLQKSSKGGHYFLLHNLSYAVEKGIIHAGCQSKLAYGDHIQILSEDENGTDYTIENLNKLVQEFSGVNKGEFRFLHSAVQGVVVPIYASHELKEDEIKFPITVDMETEIYGITLEDYISFYTEDEEEREELLNDSNLKVEVNIIKDILISKYPYLDKNHIKLLYNEVQETVLVQLVEDKNSNQNSSNTSKEEMIPTNAMVSLLYTKFPLTPDMFGGKEEVTKEEIRLFIEKERSEYAKDRTSITYDKKLNMVIVMVTGSRKGALVTVTNDLEALDMMSGDNDALFYWQREDDLYRVEKTEVACIVACEEFPQKGSYHYNLPKIPQYLLEDIISIFRYVYQTYRTEILISIFWDREEKRYFINIPRQYVSSSSCDGRSFYLETPIDMKDGLARNVLVAEIHSHASYPAFWSDLDNAEEKGFCVYGVAGSFNHMVNSMQFRAGTNGWYKLIEIEDVFEKQERVTTFNINDIIPVIQTRLIFKV